MLFYFVSIALGSLQLKTSFFIIFYHFAPCFGGRVLSFMNFS